jgi:WD40 repeat protein
VEHQPPRPLSRLQIILLLGSLCLLLGLLLSSNSSAIPRITAQTVDELHEILTLDAGMEGYPPRYFALSPEGDQLAVTSGYSNELWDLTNGSLRFIDLKASGGHSPLVFFAGDSPIAALEGRFPNVTFTDLETGAPIQRFENNTILEWAVSPDGRWIASNYDEQSLYIADVLTGERRITITPPDGYIVRNTNPTFNADNTFLATSLKKGEQDFIWGTFVWDAATGELLQDLGDFSDDGTPWSIAFSHDGSTLALGGVTHINNRLRSWFQLWNLETGSEIASWTGMGGAVYNVEFSADDRYLAANGNNDVWLWDLAAVDDAPTPLLFLEGNGSTQTYDTLALSADGKLLAVGSPGGGIPIYDVATGQEIFRVRAHRDDVRQLAFTDDGRLLISSGADYMVRFWSVGDYRPYPPPGEGSSEALPAPAMTPTIPGVAP